MDGLPPSLLHILQAWKKRRSPDYAQIQPGRVFFLFPLIVSSAAALLLVATVAAVQLAPMVAALILSEK